MDRNGGHKKGSYAAKAKAHTSISNPTPSPNPRPYSPIASQRSSHPPTPDEQVLIQRELAAELLVAQSKNKTLVAENASLREQLHQSNRNDSVVQDMPEKDTHNYGGMTATRMEQLLAENTRLSAELDTYIRKGYVNNSNELEDFYQSVLRLRHEQEQVGQGILDCAKKHKYVEKLVHQLENDAPDIEMLLMLTEQYTSTMKHKVALTDTVQVENEQLRERLEKSVGMFCSVKEQIAAIQTQYNVQRNEFVNIKQLVNSVKEELGNHKLVDSLKNEVLTLSESYKAQQQYTKRMREECKHATSEAENAHIELMLDRESLVNLRTTTDREASHLRARIKQLEEAQVAEAGKQMPFASSEVEELLTKLHTLEAECYSQAEAFSALKITHGSFVADFGSKMAPMKETVTKLRAESLQVCSYHTIQRVTLHSLLQNNNSQQQLEKSKVELEGIVKQRDAQILQLIESLARANAINNEDQQRIPQPPLPCESCARMEQKVERVQTQLHHTVDELSSMKLAYSTLQQQADKMKNVLQIYRQEKQQLEDDVEREHRMMRTLMLDVGSLRDVIKEKQSLVEQLREESVGLKAELHRVQQAHEHQISQAQDRSKFQQQMHEQELRAKSDMYDSLRKEVNKLEGKLDHKRERLKAAKLSLKRNFDTSMAATHGQLQQLSAEHHINKTIMGQQSHGLLNYLRTLETNISSMRDTVVVMKEAQASAHTSAVKPLASSLKRFESEIREAKQELADDFRKCDEDVWILKRMISGLIEGVIASRLPTIERDSGSDERLRYLEEVREHVKINAEECALIQDRISMLEEVQQQALTWLGQQKDASVETHKAGEAFAKQLQAHLCALEERNLVKLNHQQFPVEHDQEEQSISYFDLNFGPNGGADAPHNYSESIADVREGQRGDVDVDKAEYNELEEEHSPSDDSHDMVFSFAPSDSNEEYANKSSLLEVGSVNIKDSGESDIEGFYVDSDRVVADDRGSVSSDQERHRDVGLLDSVESGIGEDHDNHLERGSSDGDHHLHGGGKPKSDEYPYDKHSREQHDGGDQPDGDQPDGDQPDGDQPDGGQPDGGQPGGGLHGGGQPGGGQPVGGQLDGGQLDRGQSDDNNHPNNYHTKDHHSERGDSERGGSERGGSERGGSERGGSERGGSERGGSERGGSEHSGSNHGGSEHSGSKHGGSEHGGSEHGGSERGGSEHGGSECGGSDHVGSEPGGSEHGGSESGGSESGGSESGGSESGGSESGGSESGGSEHGGRDIECGGSEHGGSEHGGSEHSGSECGGAEHGSSDIAHGDRDIEHGGGGIEHDGGSEHGGSEHGGSEHGGSEHGGSEHGGSERGGSEHGDSEHGGSEHSDGEHSSSKHNDIHNSDVHIEDHNTHRIDDYHSKDELSNNENNNSQHNN